MTSLYLTSLNSGSNGNCYYIGNDEEAVLIDAGLSCRETEKRMCRLGLAMKKVKAVFISHEHGDHIKGLEVLSRKHQLPVYISSGTLRQAGLQLDPKLVRPLRAGIPVPVGALMVNAFLKYHDAADPHSFTVEDAHTCIGIFTDIGKVCGNISTHLFAFDSINNIHECTSSHNILSKKSFLKFKFVYHLMFDARIVFPAPTR